MNAAHPLLPAEVSIPGLRATPMTAIRD